MTWSGLFFAGAESVKRGNIVSELHAQWFPKDIRDIVTARLNKGDGCVTFKLNAVLGV